MRWQALSAVAIGLVLGALFVRRQRVMAAPLVDLQLFRQRSFVLPLGIYAVATFLVFGVYVFVAQYLQGVLGLSPWRAGLWTAPSALAFIVGSFATSALSQRVRPGKLMAFGLGVGAMGFIGLVAVQPQLGPAPLIAACVVYSLGLAPVFSLATDLIVGNVSPEHAGVAAALAETGSELGGALGIAVLGSLGAAIHRGQMMRVALPDVPRPSLDGARETLGAALALAHGLPPKASNDLLEAARFAFGCSFRIASAVAAILAVALALVAARMLERPKPQPCGQG